MNLTHDGLTGCVAQLRECAWRRPLASLTQLHKGQKRVPFRRFVGRTGGVVAPPLRAGCDFIEACLFEKKLIAVMSALCLGSGECTQGVVARQIDRRTNHAIVYPSESRS